jgi:hypothetical protein
LAQIGLSIGSQRRPNANHDRNAIRSRNAGIFGRLERASSNLLAYDFVQPRFKEGSSTVPDVLDPAWRDLKKGDRVTHLAQAGSCH